MYKILDYSKFPLPDDHDLNELELTRLLLGDASGSYAGLRQPIWIYEQY